MEQYLLLKIKAVRAGKPTTFKTIEEFFHCYNDQDEHLQCLLCELYMHNFFLEEDRDNNPSPFLGDVQFQAFLSFAKNYIRWAKAYNIFQKIEHGLDLWVRGEPTKPLQFFIQHKYFRWRKGVRTKLGPIHKDIIENGWEYFEDIQEASLEAPK